MRIANTMDDSIVDGPGLRFVVFTQGCEHRCPGCHNPETQPLDGGSEIASGELTARFGENPLTEGLTLSGGEPFLQAADCAVLAAAAHAVGWTVWAYSGYTYEQLLQRPDAMALLQELDVLVDGPFLEAQKRYELLFRGSENQRLIDVPKSLAAGAAVRWEKEDPLAHFQPPKS